MKYARNFPRLEHIYLAEILFKVHREKNTVELESTEDKDGWWIRSRFDIEGGTQGSSIFDAICICQSIRSLIVADSLYSSVHIMLLLAILQIILLIRIFGLNCFRECYFVS